MGSSTSRGRYFITIIQFACGMGAGKDINERRVTITGRHDCVDVRIIHQCPLSDVISTLGSEIGHKQEKKHSNDGSRCLIFVHVTR